MFSGVIQENMHFYSSITGKNAIKTQTSGRENVINKFAAFRYMYIKIEPSCFARRFSTTSSWRRMDPLVQGASLENIVKYVLRHTRLTDARARYLVVEVLKAGIALGRIKRTPHSTYVLASSKTAIAPRITEPKFRDNSSCSSFSE